jgi:hypothetical protein
MTGRGKELGLREHKKDRLRRLGYWLLAPQLAAAGIYYVAFSDWKKSHYGPLNEASSLVCIDKTAGIRKVQRGVGLLAFHPIKQYALVILPADRSAAKVGVDAKAIIQG